MVLKRYSYTLHNSEYHTIKKKKITHIKSLRKSIMRTVYWAIQKSYPSIKERIQLHHLHLQEVMPPMAFILIMIPSFHSFHMDLNHQNLLLHHLKTHNHKHHHHRQKKNPVCTWGLSWWETMINWNALFFFRNIFWHSHLLYVKLRWNLQGIKSSCGISRRDWL